ncbi:hypothetical protein [Belnapia sp. F-4-1]|uniref:hypothetical protein n=1 Tax=Belnapia sp. F-4-1 TaxID=1545443 RepID=UPI0005BA0ED7|nr:hypothetical protein [Belnapia sp. F-4-1]
MDRGTGCAGHRRAHLGHATAAPHRGREARLEAAGCFDNRDGYTRYLHAIALLYAALKGMLDDVGAGRWLPDWPRRRKAGLIRVDLRALFAAWAPAPRPHALPTAAPSP